MSTTPNWREEFKARWTTQNLWTFIDREMTEDQRRTLFGPESELFGALENFIAKTHTELLTTLAARIEGRKKNGVHPDSDSFDGGFNCGLELAQEEILSLLTKTSV